jgi:hypothetical protein
MGEAESERKAGAAAWHRGLHHTGHDQLSEENAQTPGMRRYEAISGTRSPQDLDGREPCHAGHGLGRSPSRRSVVPGVNLINASVAAALTAALG